MTQAAVHLVYGELLIEDKIQLNEKQGIEKEVCQERHASALQELYRLLVLEKRKCYVSTETNFN